MNKISLYNTLTGKIEEIKPLSGEKINLFVCGPTVYDYSHIGHAKTYIQFDFIVRFLRFSGYEVFYLQNITDIDDKIIKRADESGREWDEVSQEFTQAYFDDMESLLISSVSKYAKATDYIPDIIKQVQALIDKGFAYTTDDGIYFEISKYSDYGKLSGRTETKEDDAQSRIDQSNQKRGWNDFCLWKFSKPGEPVWDAPFGKGRPGWHIEDTAITEHHFGPQYDIHGGAVDLIFPHHEAEITQMESASGKKPLVQHWIHTGLLNINDAKMSKSTGNFFTIRDILKRGFSPAAIRLMMLQSHYRSTINFTWDNLEAAKNRLADFQAFADLIHQTVNNGETPDEHPLQDQDFDKTWDDIANALANDFSTPAALESISALINQALSRNVDNNARDRLKKFIADIDQLFGLELIGRADIPQTNKDIIQAREEARADNNWEEADRLRNELQSQGIEVRDTPHGPIWSKTLGK